MVKWSNGASNGGLQAMVCSPESLDLAMLPAVDPSDAVVVILARRLSSLLDSSVLLTSPKDRLLHVSYARCTQPNKL